MLQLLFGLLLAFMGMPAQGYGRVETGLGVSSGFQLPCVSSETIQSRVGRANNEALISQRLPGISTNYYGWDGHGSTRFLLNPAGGITDTWAYDAYGVEVAGTGTTLNNYRYCGQQWDGDLGMYYLRARYYKPDTGRFWTMDSYEGNSQDPQSLHKYLYCQNDPISLSDPTGHYSSMKQYYGYAMEDAIQYFYGDDHPGGVLKKSKLIKRADGAGWLFPDIFYYSESGNMYWLEVKPLSVPGVASGEAKRALNMVALPGNPDILWQPPLLTQIATGETFVSVNVGGVVYYQREDLVEKELLTMISSGIAYSAKDLVKYVSARAATAIIQGSVRPILAYSTGLAATGKAADSSRLGAHVGIAALLAVLGGF